MNYDNVIMITSTEKNVGLQHEFNNYGQGLNINQINKL